MAASLPPDWIYNAMLGLVATMFGLLTLVIGWIGNKMYQKLDEMSALMRNIEADLHGQISDLDRRVTKVEMRCELSMKGREV